MIVLAEHTSAGGSGTLMNGTALSGSQMTLPKGLKLGRTVLKSGLAAGTLDASSPALHLLLLLEVCLSSAAGIEFTQHSSRWMLLSC